MKANARTTERITAITGSPVQLVGSSPVDADPNPVLIEGAQRRAGWQEAAVTRLRKEPRAVHPIVLFAVTANEQETEGEAPSSLAGVARPAEKHLGCGLIRNVGCVT